MDKAYNAVVVFTYYHCGSCTGHRTSVEVKVKSFRDDVDAKDLAKRKVEAMYPDMSIDFEKVYLHQYSVL